MLASLPRLHAGGTNRFEIIDYTNPDIVAGQLRKMSFLAGDLGRGFSR